jgi:hypothetical protein
LGLKDRGGDWFCFQIDAICYLAVEGALDPPKPGERPFQTALPGQAEPGSTRGWHPPARASGNAPINHFDLPAPQFASIGSLAPMHGRGLVRPIPTPNKKEEGG